MLNFSGERLIMAKYETSTKDYLFAILISGTEEEKNGALRAV